MSPDPTVTTLLRHATALITGWRSRPVPRAAWHRADDLLLQAALLDEKRAMPVWAWLTEEYEIWLEAHLHGTPITTHAHRRISGM